jgi:hypothetical protein
LGAGGGVNGCGRRETLEIPESVEGLDDFLGDGIWLETGAGSLAGFPVGRRRGGRERGSFSLGRLKKALKKISAGLRPVRAMRPMPFWR